MNTISNTKMNLSIATPALDWIPRLVGQWLPVANGGSKRERLGFHGQCGDNPGDKLPWHDRHFSQRDIFVDAACSGSSWEGSIQHPIRTLSDAYAAEHDGQTIRIADTDYPEIGAFDP
jgi:hypothetical protein